MAKNKGYLDCVNYILEHEERDFIDYVQEGGNPEKHIYYTAYKCFYGSKKAKQLIKDAIED